jgi:DNA-binding LacI/PurR family transcriptional regulator
MSHGKRYASSTDVARLAGVSQSAVSRVYRPDTSVSPEMRRKVLAAAAELDYRPSAIPRIMLTHRSNLVAIVIGGMYNPFYATVLERFTVRLQDAGHQALLVHVDSGHSLDAAIPRLASYRVDAIVSALSVLSPRSAEELARFRIPVVSFNTAVNNEWVSSVCCDNLGAAREMADHLLASGAVRFGYISGPANSPANQERLAGFRDRLAERGVTQVETVGTAFDYATGYAAAIEMFSRPDRPDAVFCANDLLAIGAIDALRKEVGLQAPGDVLVAGFDDIPASSWAGYDLTTFVQDGARMVDEAMAILKASMGLHEQAGNVRVVVPARLVERRTTRR